MVLGSMAFGTAPIKRALQQGLWASKKLQNTGSRLLMSNGDGLFAWLRQVAKSSLKGPISVVSSLKKTPSSAPAPTPAAERAKVPAAPAPKPEAPAPALKAAEPKFATCEPLPKGEPEEQSLVLMRRGPGQAFAYWTLPEKDLASSRAPGAQALLELIDSEEGHSLDSLRVTTSSGRYYLDLPDAGRKYHAQIVIKDDQQTQLIARSESITTHLSETKKSSQYAPTRVHQKVLNAAEKGHSLSWAKVTLHQAASQSRPHETVISPLARFVLGENVHNSPGYSGSLGQQIVSQTIEKKKSEASASLVKTVTLKSSALKEAISHQRLEAQKIVPGSKRHVVSEPVSEVSKTIPEAPSSNDAEETISTTQPKATNPIPREQWGPAPESRPATEESLLHRGRRRWPSKIDRTR